MSPSGDMGRLHRSFAAVEASFVRDLGHRAPCGEGQRTVGSPKRRQTTPARYAGAEHRRTSPAQELRPRRK
jgi:hypothetical protein